MEFREWLLFEARWKFIAPHSTKCGLCDTPLKAIKIVHNPRHHFPFGQFLMCKCGDSRVWANSIRDDEGLLQFLKGEADRYDARFCNDPYCACCFRFLYPLESQFLRDNPDQSGEKFWDMSIRRWGCAEDYVGKDGKPKNKNIMRVEGMSEEEEQQALLKWYKDHAAEVIEALKGGK